MIKKYDWEVFCISSVELSVNLLESFIPTLMIKEIIEEARRLGISFVTISYNSLPDYEGSQSIFQNLNEVYELIDFYHHEYDISVHIVF